jgi:tRNA/rRNA methyltransferase
LEKARIVPDLGTALADCTFVVGTSARTGGPVRRQSVGEPEVVVPHLLKALETSSAAMVFGPEPSGLTDDEVTRCHYLINIPTDPTYPALNLAQAVAICLYELRSAWLRDTAPSASLAPAAPYTQQERMFDQLRSGLEAIHFLYGTNADPLMHALRHLIGRAQPSAMEIDLLFGLARQLHWIAREAARFSEPRRNDASDGSDR